VTYTAPDWLPDPPTVEITAVCDADTTAYDSCLVTLTFDKLFVDPVNGDDTNHGVIGQPFKTLTHAYSVVSSGGTIVAKPGTYSEASGESFPLICHRDSVTTVGMDWEECIIRGSATSGAYGGAVSLGRMGSALRKFTVEEGAPGDSSRIIIYIWGLNAHLDSIRVDGRGEYAVCRCENAGGTDVLIENCRFVVDDGQTLDRGINLIDDSEGAIIRNCTITGFHTGLRITGTCDAMVEDCTLEGNGTGIMVRAEEQSGSLDPDFGGGSRGSVGGNVIRNNDGCGLHTELDHAIYAKFNTWSNDPPVAGTDYCVDGSGGVVVD
jgi:hypothetical protein